jgi:hypothetical protein
MMASKQTRRSISVRGSTYAALRDYCAAHTRSMSDLVEELLGAVLEAAPITAARPTVQPIAAKVLRAPKPAAADKPEKAEAPQKPAPVKAAAASKVAVQVPAGSDGQGRPAPTPASKIVEERVKAPKGDYRTLTF